MLEVTMLHNNNREVANSFDQFNKDISEFRFYTQPKTIVALLTTIVAESCKTTGKVNKIILSPDYSSESRC